ncbi:MAG TPA: hypothetical protein VGD71_24815 [Kribbella sp.]
MTELFSAPVGAPGWRKSVDNVMTVVDNLAPHVRVIPPDALVRLLAENPRP